ncbi:MAG TPA: PKD domain-containing protein [Bacteroidia bacterium]|nr:PKD domain-containing protein [Bacteroidia bacterium]
MKKPGRIVGLIIFFIISSSYSYCQQKEGNIWYFGLNAGIDFNHTPPKAITGSINTTEGCAVICNPHGNLMFYTDGITVFDKSHSVMVGGTGLLGNSSSTQSGIIVPNPSNEHIYYIFSTSGLPSQGLYFSVIDTTRNSGFGEVVSKNIALMPDGTEKLNAIKHSNGADTWVVTHQKYNNSYYAYLVTAAGVNLTPVISSTGSNHTFSPGYLKFSPDGDKLVSADYFGVVELFDFDASTGIISNPRTIVSQNSYYGVEFSPTGKYLYLTRAFSSPQDLVQFDMRAGNISAIIASKKVIATIAVLVPGALQLAPDGKIYMALYSANPYLGVINLPDEPGTACNFVQNGFALSPNSSAWGLPSFNQSYFYKPVIDLKISTPACDVLTFNFTNVGDTDSVITSKWDFGDGTIDSGVNLTKTYTAHGTYVIKNVVTVKNKKLFTDTLTKTISTLPKPKAAIYVAEQNNCFTTNSFTFDDSTKYPAGLAYKSSVWRYTDTNYINQNTKRTRRKFNKTGTFKAWIVITATNKCTDTAFAEVTVYPSVYTSFTPVNSNQCKNTNKFEPVHTTAIDSPGKITGYKWDFGDGNTASGTKPANIYADTGKYTVRLVVSDTNGCNDTFISPITILPSPKADFSAIDVCFKDSAVINNTSSITKGLLKYQWDYGDGHKDSSSMPARLYADTGTFTIKLVAVSDSLCKDSTEKSITVKPKPAAGFSAGTTCEDVSVSFTDKTIRHTVPIAFNYWEFENGQYLTTTGNASYTFANHGIYPVKLVTGATNGCKDSVIIPLRVNPRPIAGFSINNDKQCLKGNRFEFTNITTLASGNAAYTWKLNGNSKATSRDYSESYALQDIYTIQLVAATDSGCLDSASQNITVFPQVNVDITINDTAQCFKDHLFEVTNGSVVNGSGSISNYHWSFSDGTEEYTTEPAAKKFTGAGNYSVQCIMETDKGCRDTVSRQLTVYFSPALVFDAGDVCLGNDVEFTNTTADPDNKITRWEWSFGDGGISNIEAPKYGYKVPGNYLVHLEATTADGCTDTLSKFFSQLVHPNPSAGFIEGVPENVGKLTTYKFTNTSAGAVNYNWNFGDGTTGNDQHPQKTYIDTGRFIVNLTVENQWGCTSSFNRKLIIIPETDVWIPGAFTPGNNDGLNPVFSPGGTFYTREFEMLIYNRWGELIFITNDAGKGWDGTYKGEALPGDIYMYSMSLMDLKNKRYFYRGTVLLIR